MILTDPKIQVDQGTAKKIAQIICKEISTSLDKNKSRYDLAKRCENQYQQKTKWDIDGKECSVPWKGASNYFVGLTEWIIDAIWARLMNILFSQQPYMKAKGVEASDTKNQEAVTDFIDTILREKVNLYENSRFFFKQMIKLPFAVIKFCWDKSYDRMINKNNALVFVNPITQESQMILEDDPEIQQKTQQFTLAGFIPQGQQEVWIQEDIELINDAKLEYIKFEDYVYCPNAKRDQKLYWEGDRFWLTINEMAMKAKQEQFIEDSVIKVRQNRKGDSQKQGVDAVIAERSELIECFHWYGRLPFNENNEIDLENQDAIEQEVYCVVAQKEEELLQIEHWSYNRNPFPDRVYLRGEYEETEEFEGRSMSQKLYKSQTELNDLHKTIMDNAWLAMQKIFVKRKGLAGEEWENPTVYPGAMWEEQMTGDIRVLDIGDVKSIGIELEQQILSFAERISNIGAWNLGTREEGGKPTATEFAGTLQEGNIGREPLLQKCYTIMSKICQWTYDYYYHNMPEGLERRIMGDNNEAIYPTPDNMNIYQQKGIKPYWEKDDIKGKYDYTWLGTSQNADKQWNIMVANDLQDRYLPQPMVQGNLLATWNILKMGLEARGIKDWSKILPKEDAIIQEMKRMQMEAQQRQLKQNIRARLGLPPEGPVERPMPGQKPQGAGNARPNIQ